MLIYSQSDNEFIYLPETGQIGKGIEAKVKEQAQDHRDNKCNNLVIRKR